MNICIIGNSHVGSLKRAWDNIKDLFPKINITFFAQRANGLNDLIIKKNILLPNNDTLASAFKFTSNGSREINTANYDYFVIYGADAKAYIEPTNFFYSEDVLLATIKDLISGTLSYKLLKQLRTITHKKIFIGHTPLPSERKIISTGIPKSYIKGIKKINDTIYSSLNSRVIIQPIQTIINNNATHPDFCKGSKRLAIGDHIDNEVHIKEDVLHMNDLFGELWLKELFKTIKKEKLKFTLFDIFQH